MSTKACPFSNISTADNRTNEGPYFDDQSNFMQFSRKNGISISDKIQKNCQNSEISKFLEAEVVLNNQYPNLPEIYFLLFLGSMIILISTKTLSRFLR